MQALDTIPWFLASSAHSLASSAASLLADSIYSSRFFDKDVWVNVMFGVRVALCLGSALFLIGEVRAWRMNVHLRERTKKRIALLLAVLAFGTYFDFGNEKVRYKEYYHRHEFYHYYLGAKYSKELGYTRLYDCTLVAEVENGRKSQVADREFRDLRVNLIKQVKDTYILTEPERCTNRFTAARWTDIKKDID